MREELQRRIGAALDAPGGIDGDDELRPILESDPEASAYAHDIERLQGVLREWPLPAPDDEAFESLAMRIEQRLGETLPRIEDPTLAPQFDDDDDLRDATAGLLGPVVSSGEFELEELRSTSVPPIVGASAPAPSARPPAPPKPSTTPPNSSTTPPPSAKAMASRAPAREMPKLTRASDGDRMSFPDVPHLGAPSLGEVRELPKRSQRSRYGWFAGLAAAAAVGLGVFATTSVYQGEPLR
ncbi:MAG: hypothetical protein M3Y87_32585, partial [Myxococcota bacterium]|nr:hypothetical protein [Myxococcota bacterium]